jgi:amino acid transporter
VYHTVPWQFVADESLQRDVTAPGLLGYVLPGAWAVAIIAGAAIALLNDLPAMLLAVSRLMFAWAKDGIFPSALGAVHPRRHTPQTAIIVSGLMATLGILGSHFASDFFLGIDIMVTSMLVNFLLMCLTVVTLPGRNPELAARVTVLSHRPSQLALAWLGIFLLAGFLLIHTHKDLSTELSAWYFHSTPIWLIVMGIGSAIYFLERAKLKRSGANLDQLFKQLPPE